jgi:parallel beta-helix repeat protein
MEVTMRTCLFLLTILFLAVFTSTIHAVTVLVPSQYPTIQEAIDVCVDGDTVLVADGTYTGDGNRDIDFGGRAIVVMSENGPEVTIIDCEGSPSAWHRGFYFHSGEDTNTVVQGFTITNGYHTSGGGIYCFNFSSPTITGNIITGNTASSYGGGIRCSDSSPTIAGNTISANTAGFDGGGIECWPNASPTITGNMISGNTVSNIGGGIDCYTNSSAIITGNTISQNTADVGGGIFSAYSSLTITDNTITGNTAPGGGGGLSVQLGTSIIENNVISGNTAAGGAGGFFLWEDISTISNNLITNNAADIAAGGIAFFYSSVTMSNNTIAENNTTGNGGGVWLGDDSMVNTANTIFWNNSAAAGDEIYLGYFDSTIPSTLTISYSDVEGGQSSVVVEKGCTLNWGDGMIDDNPSFMSFHGFDYLLRRFSPCIDTGDPALDDGFGWPKGYFNGPRSDMGAYGGPGNVGWLP